MNIIQVMKSRKRFRRKGDEEWCDFIIDGLADYLIECMLNRDSILADVWEIEP